MLPPELVILIVSHIRLASTLAKLCVVSSTFYAIARPALYHTLRFGSASGEGILDTAAQMRFFSGRISPSVLGLISSLYLGLGGPLSGQSCSLSWPALECSCDESSDTQFGEVLESLTSLASLHIVCAFCPSTTKDRHKYLLEHKVNTRQLESFAFQCTCIQRTEKYIVDLLSSPRVSQVSALLIEINVGYHEAEDQLLAYEAAVRERSFLPNLRTLGYTGAWYLRILLRHRPIERLGLAGIASVALPQDLPIAHSLLKEEGSVSDKPTLTAVFTDRALKWCRMVKENVGIFSEVKELGTFEFKGQEDSEILEHMAHLSVLKKLEIIYINRKKKSSEHSDVTDDLISKIGDLIQSIKWIRVSSRPWTAGDPPSVLWERRVRKAAPTQWISYNLRSPIHTYWDIIKGRNEF